jgi:hypothetical protein
MPAITLTKAAKRKSAIQEFVRTRSVKGLVPTAVQHEVARRWNVTIVTVRTAIVEGEMDYERAATQRKNGIEFAFEVVGMYLQQVPLSKIAEDLGVSKQRVHQILESARKFIEID